MAYVLSPRFGIRVPAVIDDWYSASQPNASVGELVKPFFEHTAQRFRPGFQLFDHAMWHTFGAPDMTGPNLWNALRVGLFVAAIGLVPALVARSIRPSLDPISAFLLTLIPTGLLVVGGISTDFARLEPQEPMLVGATVCGGALVLLGGDRLMMRRGRSAGTIAAFAVGWPFFLLGIFFKEASVAFLVLVAAALAHLISRWRAHDVVDGWREPLRNWRFLLPAALLIIPLLWVTYRVGTAGAQGANLYGGGSPHGLSQWIDRLKASWNLMWNGMTAQTGTSLWQGLAIAVPVLAVATWADRRRVPWLVLGCVATGLLMLIIQGLPGVLVPRYFIATMAMLIIAAVIAVAQARAWLRVVALVAATVAAISWIHVTHPAVQSWAANEKANAAFVDYNANLVEHGCPLLMTGVDAELNYSLPTLIGLRAKRAGPGPCPLPEKGLIVSYTGSVPGGPPKAYPDAFAICRTPVHQIYTPGGALGTSGCAEVKRKRVAELRAGYLLVPGVPVALRAICQRDHPGDPRCDRPHVDRNQPWP